MHVDECFELGYIIKPHGLTGAIDVFLDTDFPQDYKDLESVFVMIGQKLVPFFIETIQIQGNNALVQLEGIDSIDAALKLKGYTLYLPDNILPKLEGNEFYFHEVIGFEVYDKVDGRIGTISGYYDNPGQSLLSVDHKGKEVLVPIIDEIILKIDRENKRIDVDLPGGLLKLYTNP